MDERQKLLAEDRRASREKLNEVDGDEWLDDDSMSAAEKELLEVRLAAYESEPDAGSSWEEVETRIKRRLPR